MIITMIGFNALHTMKKQNKRVGSTSKRCTVKVNILMDWQGFDDFHLRRCIQLRKSFVRNISFVLG